MSELQYLDLMREIYERGYQKGDRTGTGTRSLFGRQMRFDLKNNQLPLLTTKKIFIRGLIEELLWFLRGSTDNTELEALNVKIWNGWALKEDLTKPHTLSGYERARLLGKHFNTDTQGAINLLTRADAEEVNGGEKLLAQEGIPTIEHRVVRKRGDLGPIYGKQWRAWECRDGRVIDQIAELIQGLKERPNSRRHIVSAWNPADLPDERISPQENVKRGRMALAACHCLFQLYVRPLTAQERTQRFEATGGHFPALNQLYADFEANLATAETGVEVNARLDVLNAKVHEIHDLMGTPKQALSCRLDQRSADFFLGVPFNIASYAILTVMLAQVCDMVPDELIWQGGDVHLYNNHFEQVEEQLRREPRPFPTLHVSPFVKNIDQFTINDFTVLDYDPHPTITAAVSV